MPFLQDGWRAMPLEGVHGRIERVKDRLHTRTGVLAGGALILSLVGAAIASIAYGVSLPSLAIGSSEPKGTSAMTSVGKPDFYAQDGMLVVNRSETLAAHRRARWVPLAALEELEERSMTGLEPELKYGDGFDLLDEYMALSGQEQMEDGDRFAFLKDKTIVLFGDSQDRYTIDYFCPLLHGKLSWREFFTTTFPQHDLSRPDIEADWRNALHHCQLPPAFGNTTIWSFMTYGSIAKNDTWNKMRPNQGPDDVLERIELAGDAFRRAGISIDLIIFHTMLWDLGAANLFDTYHNSPAASSLSVDQVLLFRRRTQAALSLANRKFPFVERPVKMYRTMHNTRPKEGTWFYGNAPDGAERIPRTPLANNKAGQLNAIMLKILPDYGFTPFDLGRYLMGFVEDNLDDKHYGPTGWLAYTQMLLYYLKRNGSPV